MRIALRHDRRLVAEQPLDLVDVLARLDHPRCEAMPQIVEAQILKGGFHHCGPEGFPDVALVDEGVGFRTLQDRGGRSYMESIKKR